MCFINFYFLKLILCGTRCTLQDNRNSSLQDLYICSKCLLVYCNSFTKNSRKFTCVIWFVFSLYSLLLYFIYEKFQEVHMFHLICIFHCIHCYCNTLTYEKLEEILCVIWFLFFIISLLTHLSLWILCLS